MSTTALIAGFVLVLARTGAMVLAAPVLGQGTSFTGYRVALIGFLSFLMFTVSGGPVEAPPIELGAMILREVLIGTFLGFLLQLVLLGVHVAGEMISHEMGFMVSRQVDPVSGVSSSLVTSLYENLFLLVLLALNGHHWLLRSLERSFVLAPVGELHLGERIAPTAVDMFAEMFRAGLVFAAPVMVFLLTVSMLIGLLSRAVPTLNVLEVGFTLRVGTALVAMFLFAPFLEPAMHSLHTSLTTWLERGLTAL